MKCDKLFHPACLIFVAVTYETIAQLYKLLIAQQTESLWVYRRRKEEKAKQVDPVLHTRRGSGSQTKLKTRLVQDLLTGTAQQQQNLMRLSLLTSSIALSLCPFKTNLMFGLNAVVFFSAHFLTSSSSN